MTEQSETSEKHQGRFQRLFPHKRMEYWAHVAHIVNAVAVTATLLFIGLEMRHSSEMAERLNRDETFQQNLQIQLAIGEHRDIAEMLIKGEADAAALDAADQLRFDRMLTAMMRGYQQIWEREQLGSFPGGYFFLEVAPGFTPHLTTPGGRAWWQHRKLAYPAGFVRDVEKALADVPRTIAPLVRSATDSQRIGAGGSSP